MEEKVVDKHLLNEKANKLFKNLLQVLENYTEDDRPKIEKAIKALEKYSKALESEFLDDVTCIIKFLYQMGNKESK